MAAARMECRMTRVIPMRSTSAHPSAGIVMRGFDGPCEPDPLARVPQVSGARTLLHFVAVATRCGCLPSLPRRARKPAMTQGPTTTEETMRLLTYIELSRYTQAELRALLRELLLAL